MKIDFFACGTYYPGCIQKDPMMGGSETVLINMAEAFASQGHSVRFYSEYPQIVTTKRGVQFVTAPYTNQSWKTDDRDVIVISRSPAHMPELRKDQLRILLACDDQYEDLGSNGPYTDGVIVLTNFHFSTQFKHAGNMSREFVHGKNLRSKLLILPTTNISSVCVTVSGGVN